MGWKWSVVGWGFLGLLWTLPAFAAAPNVVIILADDLGYGDVRVNNPDRSRLATPHLDGLAAAGMRFTDGHSSSGVCSPSRYALLTGRYHWRTRLQNGIVGQWEAPLIAPDRLTIGRLAQQAGYRTAAIGKWHLGWDWPITPEERPAFGRITRQEQAQGKIPTADQQAAWRAVFSRELPGGPTTRGFDLYFGTDVPNWPPYAYLENNRVLGMPDELLSLTLVERPLASQPGPAIPGWTFEPILPTLIDRAASFVQDCAAQRTPFLLYLPLTTPHTPLAVNAPWRGKSGLQQDVADLILETDAEVGRLLQTLDDSGVTENTFVLFTSDNGFAATFGARELEAQGHFPSGPYRDYKTSVYEGGHRVPFFIRWPGVVTPGSVCSQLVHQADVMATLAEILGSTLPETAGEDSFSLLPLLRGGQTPIRQHAVSCAANGARCRGEAERNCRETRESGDARESGDDGPVVRFKGRPRRTEQSGRP
jgi:arylsulfatase A